MIKPTLLAAACLLPLALLAQPAPLLDVADPEGDDVGDGSLVYPRDSAFAPGDLDLRGLRVFAEKGGLRFEATFSNPIRNPASVRGGGLGNEDLSVFARRGFYAFNIDVYVDTDRVNGSGQTATLPGRGARIDPAHAWEKAVVLTPRPELMRRELRNALVESAPPGLADAGAAIDASVFFASDVRVRGRTVSFFVPEGFLSARQISEGSLTVIVTAAKTTIEAGFSLTKPTGSALERLSLGAMQPEAGRPENTLGYRGDRAPATAVVDLLMPDPRQQSTQLAAAARLVGLNRENRLGAAMPTIVPAAPPAPVGAPSPAAAAAEAGGSWFSRALDAVGRAFGAGAAAPVGAGVAATAGAAAAAPAMAPAAAGIAVIPAAPPAAAAPAVAAPATPAAPATAAAPTPGASQGAAPARAASGPPAAAAAARPAASAPRVRDGAFFEEQELRLRTLKRLRDGGLISEEEYQQKRREVLDRL